MSTIKLSKTLLLFVFLVLIKCPLALSIDRPNIVWIMSEDNSKHYLKHFDENGVATPNIERLAAEGITFDRAFSNSPVCSVARTTLITSVYAPRLGTQFHRRIKLAKMPDNWHMFPYYLRQAGYYTTNNRKKDYNAIEGAGVWDQSGPRANWKNRTADAPFFHVQTFTISHEGSLHFPKSWLENDDLKNDPAKVKLAPYHPDTSLFRKTHARYLDRIQLMDEKVGELVKQLDDDGLLEDTFIFYFGDHGGVLPRSKGYAYESGLHVPLVIRIPEKWKQLSPFDRGSRTNGYVEFVDFGPTVLKLANVEIPTYVDGHPFLGVNTEKKAIDERRRAYSYADRFDEKYDLVRGVRFGEVKYVRNFTPYYPDAGQNNYRYKMLAYANWRNLYQGGKLTEIQSQFFKAKPAEAFYDIGIDPYELNNLINDPNRKYAIEYGRKLLFDSQSKMNDLSMYPESHLVEHALEDPIKFGKEHSNEIRELLEIAQLGNETFSKSRGRLLLRIRSENEWHRYWAATVAAGYGKKANRFSPQMRPLLNDENPSVRLRAIEYFGITEKEDPFPRFQELLSQSDSPTFNLEILNSWVHFQDNQDKYSAKFVDNLKVKDKQVQRRLDYLAR